MDVRDWNGIGHGVNLLLGWCGLMAKERVGLDPTLDIYLDR